MPCLLQNAAVDSLALPYPLRGVLRGGQSVVLNSTAAAVEAALGARGGGVRVQALPDVYPGPFDTDFALFLPYTRTLYVDGGSVATPADGSPLVPYRTISAALATIPAATTLAQFRTVWNVLVVGGTYDEDLAIDITGKRINLVGLGPWNLGVFDNAADWQPSGTRRNITVTGDAASVGGIRCGLSISSILPVGQRYTTHQSYINGCRISGKISLEPINASSFEVDLNAEVYGTNGGSTGDSLVTVGNPILQVYLYNCRFRGKVNLGTNGNFQHAERCRFNGLLTVPNYSLMHLCRLDAGMTVTSAANAGLFPEGLLDCYFAAGTTFTGPAGSVRCNGNTNYWLKTNAVTLAGGATKVIQDDDVA